MMGVASMNLCTSLSFPNYNCAVDIEEMNKNSLSVNIYPQPAENTLNLHFKNYYESKILIKIFDVNGRKLYNENLSLMNGKTQLFPNLENGVYILQITTPENITTYKRIVISR